MLPSITTWKDGISQQKSTISTNAYPLGKKQESDEAAINCIVLDGRSCGDFRRNGMSKFLSVAIPGYAGPASRTVQRTLSKLDFQKQHDFKTELSEVPNLSLTLDLWRSARCRHYLCITIHWLDSNFRLKGYVLSFRKFRGRHVANRIRLHMKRVLVHFNLLDKIGATTTDNGSNVKAATTQIRLFGLHLHCLAHALNLTIHHGLNLWSKKTRATAKVGNVSDEQDNSIESADDEASDDDVAMDHNNESTESDADAEEDDEQFDQDDDSDEALSESDGEQPDENHDSSTTTSEGDGDSAKTSSSLLIKDVTTLMEKCRTIVSTIRKTSILNETVHDLAKASSIKAGLVLNMRVRGNSSYKMLQRVLVYQNVLEKFYGELDSLAGVTNKQRNKLMKSKFDRNDWNLIQTLRRVLERFEEATKVLSGQKYPTSSLAYAIITSLSHCFNNRSNDVFENDIKDMLINSFEKYMVRDGKAMTFIRAAAFLDPLIHDLLTLDDKEAAESFIINEVNEKRRSKSTMTPTNDLSIAASSMTTAGANANSTTVTMPCTSKGGIVMKNFLSKCGVGSEIAKLCSIPKNDLQFDSFWQEHGNNLPKLSVVAHKYLSIAASSVPSESAFSTSNYILRKNRLALTSRNIKYGMFLKDKI
ncbi:unnamed protein product [Adineta ricciae]|uniref:HAT C-terminal dimerisation domain-containing protein n=1 Tax=Adineta ricciae TaxID=249248 RepID=A0A815HXB5_ADIRI|nr:unnamed protein product [Adineta ricciae]